MDKSNVGGRERRARGRERERRDRESERERERGRLHGRQIAKRIPFPPPPSSMLFLMLHAWRRTRTSGGWIVRFRGARVGENVTRHRRIHAGGKFGYAYNENRYIVNIIEAGHYARLPNCAGHFFSGQVFRIKYFNGCRDMRQGIGRKSNGPSECKERRWLHGSCYGMYVKERRKLCFTPNHACLAGLRVQTPLLGRRSKKH